MPSSAAILVIQQVPHEPPALIGLELTAAGLRCHTVLASSSALPPHGIPPHSIPTDASGYQGVVIMGGPTSANDSDPAISQQLALLTWCLHHDTPVLGICLGAQLLAKAAGGSITPSPRRELGWYPLLPTAAAARDPLFHHLKAPISVFQWHGESFTLPANAELLATNPQVPNQAFRLGRLYGLQFHIEIHAPLIACWIDHNDTERQLLGAEGIRAIQDATPTHLTTANTLCRRMVRDWIHQMDPSAAAIGGTHAT